jgi:hypothetical protein
MIKCIIISLHQRLPVEPNSLLKKNEKDKERSAMLQPRVFASEPSKGNIQAVRTVRTARTVFKQLSIIEILEPDFHVG